MKKAIIVILTIGAFFSCTPLKFDRMPGNEINLIPEEISGEYKLADNFLVNTATTLLIMPANINVTFKEKTTNLFINSDFYVTKVDNYYVFGKPDNQVKSLWNFVLVERKENSLYVYVIIDDKLNKHELNSVEKHFGTKSVSLGNVITEPPTQKTGASGDINLSAQNPTATEPSQIFYYGMDELAFDNFIKNDLKNYKPLIFDKVTPKNTKKK